LRAVCGAVLGKLWGGRAEANTPLSCTAVYVEMQKGHTASGKGVCLCLHPYCQKHQNTHTLLIAPTTRAKCIHSNARDGGKLAQRENAQEKKE
jgi:hypothetical protein